MIALDRAASLCLLLPLLALGLLILPAHGECPPCQQPNPEYDPNHPYPDEQSEPECINGPDGPIEGEPCKECKGGEIVEKPLLCYELEEKGEEKAYGCNCSEGKGNDVMPSCSPRVNTYKYYRAKESCRGFATYYRQSIIVYVERPCKTSYDWNNLNQVPAGICLASCVAAALLKSPSGAAECLVCLHDNFHDFDPCDYLNCDPDNNSLPLILRKYSDIGGLKCD